MKGTIIDPLRGILFEVRGPGRQEMFDIGISQTNRMNECGQLVM